MKKLYSALGALALLFAPAVLLAQNFLPFSPNNTYYFSNSNKDFIYSLRVDSVATAGTDSVFYLNKNVKKGFFRSVDCQNGSVLLMHKIVDNMFTDKLVKHSSGDLLFLSSGTDTFRLKTNAATNQTWPFRNNSSLTVTLTSKTVENFSGVSDSVYTYTLSNGKTFKLSKNYGFIKAHALKPYYDADAPEKEWELYALPEKGIGKHTLNALTIYDYQPGDSIGWHESSISQSGPTLCNERWLRKIILSKQFSSNQDTVWYEVERYILQKNYGRCFGGPPNSFTHDTITAMYTVNSHTRENVLMQGWGHGPNILAFIGDSTYRSNINNRYISTYEPNTVHYDTCTQQLIQPTDGNRSAYFLEGVGLLRSSVVDFQLYSVDSLEFYRKGSESYGTYTPFSKIMSSKEKLFTEAPTAYPNPFTSDIVLQFSSGHAMEIQLRVYNQLGQQVYSQPYKIATGKQVVELPLQKLSKGLYMIQISYKEKQETLRVIKQ